MTRQEYMKEFNFKNKFTPNARYNAHKAYAKRRGKEFKLTFEDWWHYWEPYFEKRGSKPDEYCMARLNDEGAYEVGNVEIITNFENNQERNRNFPAKRCGTTGQWV